MSNKFGDVMQSLIGLSNGMSSVRSGIIDLDRSAPAC